jgi:hypothetical protein
VLLYFATVINNSSISMTLNTSVHFLKFIIANGVVAKKVFALFRSLLFEGKTPQGPFCIPTIKVDSWLYLQILDLVEKLAIFGCFTAASATMKINFYVL